ncbi:MAG: LysM peptidoglycan-binding domain-containing protein [Chloroflexi bacterium]|nr:MAG: LysM peptidoglycan-binding domain-containing protein [Chloroflexota bacterium]
MKQKLLLLLLLVLGLVTVACQQNGNVVSAEVSTNEVAIVAEVPQEVVEAVEAAPTQSKTFLKIGSPKVDSAGKGVVETAVTVPQVAEKTEGAAVGTEVTAAIPVLTFPTETHIVEEGEWIFEIARCYGTSPQAIINANFLHHSHYGYWHYGYWYYGYGHTHNANYIYPGQQLTIPEVGSVSTPYGPPCVRKHENTYQHPMGTPGTYIHKVEQGDWIYEVARCYGTDPKHIMRANGLYNPDYIKPNQLLVIPLAGSTDTVDGPDCIDLYTVVTGDTWASIAAAHNTTEAILMRANPGPLMVGSRIWVPVH